MNIHKYIRTPTLMLCMRWLLCIYQKGTATQCAKLVNMEMIDMVTMLSPRITMYATELVMMYASTQLDVCLVLDIHGTLLCDRFTHRYPRPHLRSFLLAAFGMCRHVGIWTSARARDIPRDLDVISAHTPRDCKYAFLWDERHLSSDPKWHLPSQESVSSEMQGNSRLCSTTVCSQPHIRTQKQVARIWNTPELRASGFTQQNTILIDNNVPESSASHCIKIKTFMGMDPGAEHDTELLSMIGQIQHQASSSSSHCTIEDDAENGPF